MFIFISSSTFFRPAAARKMYNARENNKIVTLRSELSVRKSVYFFQTSTTFAGDFAAVLNSVIVRCSLGGADCICIFVISPNKPLNTGIGQSKLDSLASVTLLGQSLGILLNIVPRVLGHFRQRMSARRDTEIMAATSQKTRTPVTVRILKIRTKMIVLIVG